MKEKEIIKTRVLYVDDEETNLTSFNQLFRRNFDIYTALSADEGIAILSENMIDVVITDQRMPGVNGSDFLKHIAENFPDTLRFMLTGYSDLQALVDAVNNGNLDGYLSKPLDSDLLLKKIEKGLKVKHLVEINSQLLNETIESEKKFRGLIESAPDSMVFVNIKMEIELVNKQFEKLFKYKRKDIIGKSLQTIIPDRFKNHHKLVSGYIKSPTSREMGNNLDIYAKRNDGSEFPVEITLSPLKSKSGVIVIATIRDITARKEAETELKKHQYNLEILIDERTEKLKSANTTLVKNSKELEEFNNAMLNREMRVIELKEEVNKLARALNKEIPYPEFGDDKKD